MEETEHLYSATDTELAVVIDIFNRKRVGLKKYGMSVADNPLSLREWLQHALEEALDMSIYLKRAIAEIDKKGAAS